MVKTKPTTPRKAFITKPKIEINTGYQGYFEINPYPGENIPTWADGYIDQEPNPL